MTGIKPCVESHDHLLLRLVAGGATPSLEASSFVEYLETAFRVRTPLLNDLVS